MKTAVQERQNRLEPNTESADKLLPAALPDYLVRDLIGDLHPSSALLSNTPVVLVLPSLSVGGLCCRADMRSAVGYHRTTEWMSPLRFHAVASLSMPGGKALVFPGRDT